MVTQQASGGDSVQPKPNWLQSSGSLVLYQLQNEVRPRPPSGCVTCSKFLHFSALPHPKILVGTRVSGRSVGVDGPESLAGQQLQTGRLTEAFRIVPGLGRAQEYGSQIPLWSWGRRQFRKGLVQSHSSGRPWPTFLEG